MRWRLGAGSGGQWWIMSKTAGNDVKQRVKSTWREGPVSMDAGDGAVTIRQLLFLLFNTVADLT